ncbi:hypothetical protein WA026_005114 [Henosepilachna vigintioctopunctata]|uniref:CRAL-TRIO domain-containing protein n=1 Tax=Henosepilachna vigintioctopunctata TaxID=420089 RepID=A0AAW1UUI8_9CUCU
MNNECIVRVEYERDSTLKEADVLQIKNWLKYQPHLPGMTELEIIWFLRSCYHNIDNTKVTIEKYFNIKTSCRELLGNRHLDLKVLKDSLDVILFYVMPKRTPDGSTAVICHLIDTNPENYNFNEAMKMFDLVVMVDMFKNGSYDGVLCCCDMKGVSFSHLPRIGLTTVKNFLTYLQECMPIRLKAIHFFNVTAVMDAVLKIIKPFMKKEIVEMIHLHQTVEDLSKVVPLEFISSDFGGGYKPIDVLHDEMKILLRENENFLIYQEKQVIDESKRVGKSKNSSSDLYGVEGSFKKLELD